MPAIQLAASTFESAGDRLLNRLLLIGAGLTALLRGGSPSVALIYRRFGKVESPLVECRINSYAVFPGDCYDASYAKCWFVDQIEVV